MENIETLLAAVAQTQGFDDDEPMASTPSEVRLENSGSSPVVHGDDSGSNVIGEIFGDVRPSAAVDTPLPAPTPVVVRVIGDGGRRKRGRPPKGQVAAKPPPPKRAKVEDEEEDVCFICFDGGSLVLCDRKGCPKAYHTTCIKRDEEFFKSKAKWNCGWHICSVCEKASHYMCYTCTYSLCKGCTKDADYLCVRGNKGFCSTCMKTIMLIENKDHATNESVQVDFDDKTSWEYLFKVYWVLLKEKLSLTLSELMQAKKPCKGVAAVACKPQFSKVLHTTVGGEASISYRSSQSMELNKPGVDINLIQNDGLRAEMSSNGNHVEKLNSNKGEHGLSYNKDNVNPNADQVTHETSIDKATDELRIKEATDEPCLEKDRDDSSIAKDSNKPCMCKNTSDGESDRPGIDSTQWASKDLLEFVAHMKNGDTSPISQFDVQKLLLDYIKRNNLRDPSRKSQIICDLRLKNLFGKPRVGHIEMLKLLEYHFLIKEDSQKSSFIPAGLVTSMAGDVKPMASPVGIDDNIYEFPVVISHSHRKRKTRKKGEDRAPQHDLNEYAAIDVHNINLIFLRRNLMENIIEDHENFSNKVIGSIVRIRTNDQKPEVFRLVQVVGTSKVAEPYKIGEKAVDVMLEVLNLDKKEVVSIDAISNQEFTEDECRRLRQSIRCGFVKQFTVGEVQKKALALQSVRVNDWLEAEILRLNHLRDRASEKGHKKKLREYVDRLQLLKSPEERQRRISEVPEIHADPKMNPNYESEEDTRGSDHNEKDEYVKPSYSRFRRNGRKPISPNKKGIEKRSTEAQNRVVEKTDACGSNSTDTHMNQINIDSTATGVRNDQAMQRSVMKTSTATASTGNSPSANNIETEKLWHYRDPNGKIQGPFPMMQLRKWSVTGVFPFDMRIWTNHEQYDSLLLTDALNGKLHGASDLSYKPSSGSRENGAIGGICISEGTHGTSRDDKQNEATGCSMSVLSDNNNAFVKVDESASSGWPQCWDLLKDSNSSADDVRARNLLPSSSSGKAVVALSDRDQQSDDLNYVPESVEKNSTGLSQCPMSSGQELQNQSNNEDQAGQSSEENPRSLNIDLSSDGVDSGSVIASATKPPDSSKQAENIEVLDLPSPTSKTENQQPVDADVPMQDSCILELLNPTPRSNNEHQVGHAVDTKQPELLSFPLPSTGPAWIGPPSLGMGGMQLPEVADEWCGYSPTRAKSSVQEWDSGLVSAASSKPPELACENIDASASESHQFTHVSTSHPVSNMPNWLAMTNEPIEFDAFGEEAVSDLLAAVDAMESRGESQGALPSPTSAMKFARELMEECKDDCFSSIEEFSSPLGPRKSDALSSTSDVQLTSQSSVACKPIGTSPVDAFDSFRRSSVHSSASSEGETNAPVHSSDAGSEYHPPAPNDTNQDMVATTMAPGSGSDAMDPSWGTVQGNINLVTVQGNVNLVLGGPAQGVANLGWGTNHGTAWPNPNMNHSPRNGSLPWDGQRKYSGERFNSPREWGYQGSDSGFGRGRPPWGRQPYGGGGYSRPLPKGQRVCKFYESGRCKKGAFCDYLHP